MVLYLRVITNDKSLMIVVHGPVKAHHLFDYKPKEADGCQEVGDKQEEGRA
jgi:hypothetical protein